MCMAASPLERADFSFNNVSGSLPHGVPQAQLQSLKLEGNPYLRGPGALPSWVVPSGQEIVQQVNTTHTCPRLIAKQGALAFSIDPSYYAFSTCSCIRCFNSLRPLFAD